MIDPARLMSAFPVWYRPHEKVWEHPHLRGLFTLLATPHATYVVWDYWEWLVNLD